MGQNKMGPWANYPQKFGEGPQNVKGILPDVE